MNSEQHAREWVTITAAAALIDVPLETISGLAIPWQETEVPHRIRFRLLVLEPGTKGEPRFLVADLKKLLSTPENPLELENVASKPTVQRPRYNCSAARKFLNC